MNYKSVIISLSFRFKNNTSSLTMELVSDKKVKNIILYYNFLQSNQIWPYLTYTHRILTTRLLLKKKTFKQPHAGLCVKIYKQESNEVSITLKTWNKLEVNNLYFCRRVKKEQWRFFQGMIHFVQEMRQLTYKKKNSMIFFKTTFLFYLIFFFHQNLL